MSLQITKNEPSLERLSHAISNRLKKDQRLKVMVPYDGSESGEAALDDLRRAGQAVRVAQDAHCSVRIARAADRKDDSPIRIIIGIDVSERADHVIQAVADRVWPLESEARLVAVRKSGPRHPKKDSEAALLLEQTAERLGAVGLRVSSAIMDGHPPDVLMQEARKLSADCIFIDAHGLSNELDNTIDRAGLGKVAEALVLGAHCSVEVVRAKNLTDEYLIPAA